MTLPNGDFLQTVVKGDSVVYPEMTVRDSSYVLEAGVKVRMVISKIKSITWDGTPGLAEVGAGMDIELEDGKTFHGDSENEFHGLFKIVNENRRIA